MTHEVSFTPTARAAYTAEMKGSRLVMPAPVSTVVYEVLNRPLGPLVTVLPANAVLLGGSHSNGRGLDDNAPVAGRRGHQFSGCQTCFRVPTVYPPQARRARRRSSLRFNRSVTTSGRNAARCVRLRRASCEVGHRSREASGSGVLLSIVIPACEVDAVGQRFRVVVIGLVDETLVQESFVVVAAAGHRDVQHRP